VPSTRLPARHGKLKRKEEDDGKKESASQSQEKTNLTVEAGENIRHATIGDSAYDEDKTVEGKRDEVDRKMKSQVANWNDKTVELS